MSLFDVTAVFSKSLNGFPGGRRLKGAFAEEITNAVTKIAINFSLIINKH
jgi:hypothetical protein